MSDTLTHFAVERHQWDDPLVALCGAPLVFNGFIDRGNPKADCERCVDIHARTTGWSFPLPELIA